MAGGYRYLLQYSQMGLELSMEGYYKNYQTIWIIGVLPNY